MLYGLSFLPDCTGKNKSPQSYFEEALELCVIADNSGLEYIKMTEHYLHPYGGYCPSPLSFLSAVASVTRKIRLITGCVLPVFHHPIQLAADTSMLDAICQGRLEVGFARAYLPYEFASLGVNIDESRTRFTETIQTVIKLWTEDSVSCDSPYFSFKDAKSFPKPTQSPHPPVWGAAVNSRQSFAWLAENLFSLLVTPPIGKPEQLIEKIELYRNLFEDRAQELGSKKKPKVLMSIPLIITETQQETETATEKYLGHYLNIWRDATRSLTTGSSPAYPNYDRVHHALMALTPQEMAKKKHALIGPTSYIIDAIQEIQSIYPIDGIIWQIDFGEQPREISKKTLLQFIQNTVI